MVSSACPGTSQRASERVMLPLPELRVEGSGWLDAFGFSFGFPIGPSRPLPPSHPRFLQQLDRTLPVLPTVLLHFARTSVSASHLSAARPVSLSLSPLLPPVRSRVLSLSFSSYLPSHFCRWSLVWFRSPDAFTQRCFARLEQRKTGLRFMFLLIPRLKSH